MKRIICLTLLFSSGISFAANYVCKVSKSHIFMLAEFLPGFTGKNSSNKIYDIRDGKLWITEHGKSHLDGEIREMRNGRFVSEDTTFLINGAQSSAVIHTAGGVEVNAMECASK